MTATESLRHPWLRPRPPLPAPTLPAPRQEEEESSSPTPTSTPIRASSPAQETMKSIPTATQEQVNQYIVPQPVVPELVAPTEQAKPNDSAKPSVPTSASSNDQTVPPLEKKDGNPPVVSTADCKEVLQVAKVNLRQFVERWNSNPDSPFQINSESPQRAISLLISNTPSQLDSSPTSSTDVSPSPPSFSTPTLIPTSLTVKDATPTVSMESDSIDASRYSTNIVSSENHVRVTETVNTVNSVTTSQSTTTSVSTTRVEAAIEQTSALLKSVKESLIRQIETGTAVRDRTGARVWERKGSGMIGSPGPAGQRRTPQVQSASMGSTSDSQQRTPKEEEVQDTKFQTPQESEPIKNEEVLVVESIEDWEIHPPVEARTFGFAKRHKTINSTVKVVTATESLTTASYSLNSSSSVIEMDSHQP